MITDIPDLLARRAEQAPDAIAFQQGDVTLSYGALDRRAGQAAALLADAGLCEGDRVAILCRNRIAFFELLLASARLGTILVPLNWRMPPAELAGLVEDCGPRLVVHGAEDREAARALGLPTLDLDGDYEARRDTACPLRGRTRWPADVIWYLLYTSGTTGRPKGVVYTFRMALANHVNITAAIGIGRHDSVAHFLPSFHTAGINLHSLPALIAGARVHVLPDADIDALVGLLQRRALTIVFAVPTVYQSLIDHPGFAAAPLDAVRHWASGGAPLPAALIDRYAARGITLCNGLGMTETGPTAFLADPADARAAPGTIGHPLLLCSVRLVDRGGRDVGAGEVGELLFAGPGVTPGYWRRDADTAAAFTPEGWLRSGDLARRDEAGRYHVAGRLKEMFVSGGENVYPAEVENILATHPAVAEAAVMAAPDPRWGEVGFAWLRPASVDRPDGPALADWCRARIAAYKVPVGFTWVDDFPRTAAGKVCKHLLVRPFRMTDESGHAMTTP